MSAAKDALQYVVTAGLLGLAAVCLVLWLRYRGRQRGSLLGALGMIALVPLLGLIAKADRYQHGVVAALIIVAFLATAFFLLRFRDTFLPVPLAWKVLAGALLLAAGIFAIAADLPVGRGASWTSEQLAAVAVVIGAWLTVVAEPIVRFWIAARGRPRVQSLRLRSLSIAYALVVAVFLAVGASYERASELVSIVSSAVAIVLFPMLYAALTPPGWLRRAWRRKEEQELALTRDLVQFAYDRRVLGERALDWAMRLVGADGGALIDADGAILAQRSLPEDLARSFATAASSQRASLLRVEATGELAITVPITRENGHGMLVVLSGPFTLIFGSDEVGSLEEHGEVIGYALDRVALTETKRQLEETKTQFLANAAHELRTPLASIVGFSELFAEGIDRMPAENVQEGLAAIIRQGRRMSLLISDLLDLTQLELGRARIDLQPLLLLPAIRQSVANSLPPGGRDVQVDVGPSTAVLADPTRLDQVFTNLLTNAFRYGGDNVAIEAISGNGTVRVVVADDGAGIPADLEPHLFEPFSRGKSSMPSQGSGLGLAIVRSLVEAFGGNVSYEPGVPSGARFVVDLVRAETDGG